MKKRKKIFIFFLVLISLIWFYTNPLIGVNTLAKKYYTELKIELKKQNLNPKVFAISGKRWKLDNYLLTVLGGAASKSKHRLGEAIDIIVLDVNDDGISNSKDVDLVYKILNTKIIKHKGGIGTYKNESGFFNQQMIHFDCRGKKARWHR